MRTRGANASQKWWCSKCKKNTVHRIMAQPKSGVTFGGDTFWTGYSRMHACASCASTVLTIELPEPDLRKLEARKQALETEVQTLRRLRAKVEAALKESK